jgi:hypothetical protein
MENELDHGISARALSQDYEQVQTIALRSL